MPCAQHCRGYKFSNRINKYLLVKHAAVILADFYNNEFICI